MYEIPKSRLSETKHHSSNIDGSVIVHKRRAGKRREFSRYCQFARRWSTVDEKQFHR